MNQNEGQGWRLVTAAGTSMDSARNWGWALKGEGRADEGGTSESAEVWVRMEMGLRGARVCVHIHP